MSVSERALEHLEKTAQSVGFGNRSDYPHLGKSPVSVADWKGDSIAACVFADFAHAKQFLDKSLPELSALGGELKADILPIEAASGVDLFVCVITAVDLVHVSDQLSSSSSRPELPF